MCNDKLNAISTIRGQKGVATLLITVMILIGITLISLFATKVGILDQKISGNEFRHKEAFANAEAAAEQAAAFLSANPRLHNVDASWISCTSPSDLTSSFPCDLSGTTHVYGSESGGVITSTVIQISALTNSTAYLVKKGDKTVALGVGAAGDGTGEAIVQVEYAKSNLLTVGAIPSLMFPTGSLSGSFTIVPNPNGGGNGVPISVWSKNTLDTAGANWKTCHHGEFQDAGKPCLDVKADGESWSSCSCNEEISSSGNVNTDLVLVSGDKFPVSPFNYLFGNQDLLTDGVTLKSEIKERARATGLLLPNCDTIVSDFSTLTASALVWIEGDCILGGAILGSRSKPIILVVEDLLRVNANAEVWGILVSLNDFVLNGGPVVHGAAISEIESDLTNGNYSQVYDEGVFASLRDDAVNSIRTKVKYSWRDF